MPTRSESGKVTGTYRPPKKKRRPPASQGHPSQGAPTVGGGTGGRKPTRYKSPTPKPTVAPVSDVRTRGDKAPRGSGHSTRAQRIKANRAERRSALRQLVRPGGLQGIAGIENSSSPVGMPSPAAARAQAKEDARIKRDIAALSDDDAPRHRRTAAAERLADSGVVSSLSELRTREALKPKKAPKKKPTLSRAGTKGWEGGVEIATLTTPALKILNELTRPAEFIAGSVDYDIRRLKEGKLPTPRGSVRAGWESGGSRENRKTGADVLRTAGAEDALEEAGVSKKAAHGIVEGVGFVGDVALDPTTYLAFGVTAPGKVAARAAAKAAAKAEEKAIAAGASRQVAKKARSKASREAYQKAAQGRGISVGVGKHRTSGRASAEASKRLGGPAIGERVSGSKVAEGARKVFPVRPKNITPDEWAELKAADRERRGTMVNETRRVARRGRAVRKALGGAQRRLLPERATADSPLRVLPRSRKVPEGVDAKVRDAIEAQDFSKLTHNERQAAQVVMAEQERLLKLRRDAGEQPARYQPREPGEPEGYVYRQTTKELEGNGGVGRPRKRTTTMKDFQRTDRRPMSEARVTDPGKYVEDLEQGLRTKGQKDVARAANTQFRGRVIKTGRPLKESVKWDGATEAPYMVDNGRLVEVDASKTFVPNDVVVLKRAIAEHANSTMEAGGRLAFIDATTNAIKYVLTVPNPQYWARNLYGGVTNAFESGVPARHILRDTPTATKVNRAIRRRYKAEETIGASTRSGRSVKVLPKGGRMDVDKFIDELERVNLSGGGMTQELLGAEFRRRGLAQGAEDFPRLVAYIHARRLGKSPDDSAAFALNSQFDYGALSAAERSIARRIFPFYTFRSRNIVFQVESLFMRPGKLANIEKLRDTMASIAGLDEDWEDRLTEAEKLGVPFPMPFTMHIPGEGDTPVMIFPALPLTDLNMLTLSFPQLGQQIAGSAHPLPKAVVEYLTGYSIFFRDYIEQPYSRWSSAPDYLIDDLPQGARDQLVEDGVLRKGKDRWTGKVTWQWRAKTDYLSNLFPILSVGTAQATSGRNRSGRNSQQQLFAWLTGLRPKPYVPKTNQLYQLYDERENVRQRIEDFSELQVGKNGPEYRHLQGKMDTLDEQIYRLEGTLGKKVRGDAPSGAGPANPFKAASKETEDNPFKASSGGATEDNPFK